MAKFTYWFEVTRNGDPIEGSNIRSLRQPKSGFKKWKKIVTQAQVCCDPNTYELEESEGRKVRYWVRNDENQNPISGTLMKSKMKPSLGDWIEIVGDYCCDVAPTIDDPLVKGITGSPEQFNILTEGNAVDPQGATVTLIDPETTIDSVEENMELVVDNVDGTVTVTVLDTETDADGTFSLTMTDGKGHRTTFTFTVEYTAPE